MLIAHSLCCGVSAFGSPGSLGHSAIFAGAGRASLAKRCGASSHGPLLPRSDESLARARAAAEQRSLPHHSLHTPRPPHAADADATAMADLLANAFGAINLDLAPRVSVVVPTRGTKPEQLDRALRSVLAQTLPPYEIIVVVDGDAQKAASIRPPPGPCKVAVLSLGQPSNGRPGLVRNRGCGAARGDWVAFLDDDDVWAPDKLRLQLEAMRGDGTRFCCTAAVGTAVPCRRRLVLSDIMQHNCVVCSSVVVCMTVLRSAQFFGDEPYGQDWRCWQRCLQHTDGSYLPDALVRLNDDASDLDRSTVRAEGRQALRAAIGETAPAALAAQFAGFM